MKTISFGPVQIQIKKGGILHRWRLTAKKKWRKLPMPQNLVYALEDHEFFDHTLPDMVNLGKMFGL